jgi:hypothetical protein
VNSLQLKHHGNILANVSLSNNHSPMHYVTVSHLERVVEIYSTFWGGRFAERGHSLAFSIS